MTSNSSNSVNNLANNNVHRAAIAPVANHTSSPIGKSSENTDTESRYVYELPTWNLLPPQALIVRRKRRP